MCQVANHLQCCSGYSAEAVVGYILALARKAPNVDILVTDLHTKVSQAVRLAPLKGEFIIRNTLGAPCSLGNKQLAHHCSH